jgi:hypothetical protein
MNKMFQGLSFLLLLRYLRLPSIVSLMTPAWLPAVFTALMLGVAAVSAARLAAARLWRHDSVIADTDVAHLLMATAMAGMLTPRFGTLPDTAWEIICGLLAAWFAVRVALDARANGIRALAGGHCAPHFVHSVSMLYMFLALSPSAAGAAGMNGMPGGPGMMTTLRYPTLAFAFALVLSGYSVWDIDRLSGRRYGSGVAGVSLAAAGAARVPAMSVARSASAVQPATATPEGDGRTTVAVGEQASSDAGAVGSAANGNGGFLLSPAVTVACRITMGVAMAFMLMVAV